MWRNEVEFPLCFLWDASKHTHALFTPSKYPRLSYYQPNKFLQFPREEGGHAVAFAQNMWFYILVHFVPPLYYINIWPLVFEYMFMYIEELIILGASTPATCASWTHHFNPQSKLCSSLVFVFVNLDLWQLDLITTQHHSSILEVLC